MLLCFNQAQRSPGRTSRSTETETHRFKKIYTLIIFHIYPPKLTAAAARHQRPLAIITISAHRHAATDSLCRVYQDDSDVGEVNDGAGRTCATYRTIIIVESFGRNSFARIVSLVARRTQAIHPCFRHAALPRRPCHGRSDDSDHDQKPSSLRFGHPHRVVVGSVVTAIARTFQSTDGIAGWCRTMQWLNQIQLSGAVMVAQRKNVAA